MTLITDRRNETMLMMLAVILMAIGCNENHKHSSQSNAYNKCGDSVKIRSVNIGCSGKMQ